MLTISLLQSLVSLRKIFISEKFREVSVYKPSKQTFIMEDIQEKYNLFSSRMRLFVKITKSWNRFYMRTALNISPSTQKRKMLYIFHVLFLHLVQIQGLSIERVCHKSVTHPHLFIRLYPNRSSIVICT